MNFPVRAKPFLTQMRRGQFPTPNCRHARVDGLQRLSGRNASPSGITPSNIMSPTPEPTRGPWTEVRLGARAHNTHTADRARASPGDSSSIFPDKPPDPALDPGPLHK